jgi:hypothetical protein
MATKRTPVQRLRPLTQQSVIVRPVNTYVQPAPVQEGGLRELSNFLNKVEPTLQAKFDRDRKAEQEADRLRAVEIAKTSTAAYDELVANGTIDPAESPIFRFAFNETRGGIAGNEFIQSVSQDYARSGLTEAIDSSTFNDWYNKYYEDYVANNQGVLGLEGAFPSFDKVANQARQNLLSQHIATSNSNFEEVTDTAYANYIFHSVANVDFDDPDSVINYQTTLALKQADLAQSGGINYNYSAQNKKTVDALIDYYAQAGNDIDGLQKALQATSGGTGNLAGTRYAQVKLAETRTKFADARWKAEERKRKEITWNTKTTLDNIHQVFMNAFSRNERSVNKIMIDARATYGDEVVNQWLHFHPTLAVDMEELKEKFVSNFTTEPMSLEAQARVQQHILATPAERQIQEVVNLVTNKQVTDSATLNKLMNLAVSNAQYVERGERPRDATKDPVASTFRPGLFTGFADNFTDTKATRFTLFKTEYFDLYHRKTPDGSGYMWDQMTQAEKFQKLVEIMERAKQIESIVNADGSKMPFRERQEFMNPDNPIPLQPKPTMETLTNMP